MVIKHLQILVIILFLSIIFFSAIGIAKEDNNVPKMVIDQMFHYYGDVTKGDVLSHSFVVRNEGKGYLNIKSAKPD